MDLQRNESLTPISRQGRTKDGHANWLFLCGCGKTAILTMSRVKDGSVTSCGCLFVKPKPNLKHGMRGTTTYSSWLGAKARCLNTNSKDYARYGAKGVTFSSRWMDFEVFLSDMGKRPDGTSLDRIDNTKGYEPGNCRWATAKQQASNRTSSFYWIIKGITFDCLRDAASHFGVSEHSVHRWAHGSFDRRRNSFTPPRHDCTKERKYASEN